MPSPLYTKVLRVASSYVDAQKASEILERQLAKCGADNASFGHDELAKVQRTLVGAIQLYVTEKERCYKLADEIKALV